MSIWLWEASGPGYSASGVSQDRQSAQAAAAALVAAGQADTAQVQEAMLDTVDSEYRRFGDRWQGHRTVRGTVRWRVADRF